MSNTPDITPHIETAPQCEPSQQGEQENPRARARTYARARRGRKSVRRQVNVTANAQRELEKALARAASLGVTELPVLPPGVQSGIRAVTEHAMRTTDAPYRVAGTMLRVATDPENRRCVDAAAWLAGQTEDPRVKRTEQVTTQRRIVLDLGARDVTPVPAGEGGTSEVEKGPIRAVEQSCIPAVSDRRSPVDGLGSVGGGGGMSDVALGPMPSVERVVAMEARLDRLEGLLGKILEKMG